MRPVGRALAERDVRNASLLAAAALGVHALTALWAASGIDVPLGYVAGFFDGSLYLEIAKSFPLPFAPEARDYAGQAPAYPALIHLARLAVPDAWAHWGMLALWTSWVPAALCAAAFYALCRQLGVPPVWPTVVFVAANPRWLWVAATAHPESLAMLFALLTAVAFLRERLGWAVFWLSLAGLSRFPALLMGVALAWGALVARPFRLRSAALLSIPLWVFALLHLYLFLRIPDFRGIGDAHGVFLQTQLTWPFAALLRNGLDWLRGEGTLPDYGTAYVGATWTAALFYTATAAAGLRSRDREGRFLGLWVAAVAGLHVCLSGAWSGFDFMRLAILAWPAALLIAWRELGSRVAPSAAGAICVAAAALSAATAVDWTTRAARWQGSNYPWPSHAIRGFRTDEPRWIDYRGRFAPRPPTEPAGETAP